MISTNKDAKPPTQMKLHCLVVGYIAVSSFFAVQTANGDQALMKKHCGKCHSGDTVEGEFETYGERSIVHTILDNPSRPLDLDRIARDLLIHSKDMNMVIEGIRGHLANTNPEDAFIPADASTPLPWWIQG